jgi:hypothetical protein
MKDGEGENHHKYATSLNVYSINELFTAEIKATGDP